MSTTTTKTGCTASTLQKVAAKANGHYWEVHSLLTACSLMAANLDDDHLELKTLLSMATMQALEMQGCFNPYIAAGVTA